MAQERGLRFRWRGLACLEIESGSARLLVDPCFRRFPLWRMCWGYLTPTPGLKCARASPILVTHAHWDHLLDAPPLACSTGAEIIGSANVVRLARARGVPPVLLREAKAGDCLGGAGWQLEVLPGRHEWVPGFGAGKLPRRLRLPLRARDYRLDAYFSYLITLDGVRLLTDPGMSPREARPADILFVQPQRSEAYYRETLARVRPRLVVLVHWDSLFRASPKPAPSYLRPRCGWPPLKRVSLPQFASLIERMAPTARVVIPEIDVWETYHPGDTS